MISLEKLKGQDVYLNYHAQQNQPCDIEYNLMKIRRIIYLLPDFFYVGFFWVKLGFPLQEGPDHSRDISCGITTSSIPIHAVNHMEGNCIIHPQALN